MLEHNLVSSLVPARPQVKLRRKVRILHDNSTKHSPLFIISKTNLASLDVICKSQGTTAVAIVDATQVLKIVGQQFQQPKRNCKTSEFTPMICRTLLPAKKEGMSGHVGRNTHVLCPTLINEIPIYIKIFIR